MGSQQVSLDVTGSRGCLRPSGRVAGSPTLSLRLFTIKQLPPAPAKIEHDGPVAFLSLTHLQHAQWECDHDGMGAQGLGLQQQQAQQRQQRAFGVRSKGWRGVPGYQLLKAWLAASQAVSRFTGCKAQRFGVFIWPTPSCP